ncbi:MAG: hypothetical protein U0359_28065 [Byssovorax sp.]
MNEPPLFDDVIWTEAARARGLSAHVPTGGVYLIPLDFAAIEAHLGDEVPLAEARSEHWLAGRAGDRKVLLRRAGSTAGCMVDVAFDPPLRLGLRMHSVGPPVTLGPPTVRDAFSIKIHDGRQIDALFAATEEGRALAAELVGMPLSFVRISDSLFGLSLITAPQGARSFLDLLDRALDLAAKIEAARAAMPAAPWEQALARVFRKAGRRIGADLDPTRMTLSGELDGVPVSASAPMVEQAIATRVEARLDPPLGLGLSIGPEGAFPRLRALMGLGDIQTGNAAFDRVFHVRGAPKEAVLLALGEQAQKALLTAHADEASVVVTDEKVEIVYPREMKEPEELDRALIEAVSIARGLRATRTSGSPYR